MVCIQVRNRIVTGGSVITCRISCCQTVALDHYFQSFEVICHLDHFVHVDFDHLFQFAEIFTSMYSSVSSLLLAVDTCNYRMICCPVVLVIMAMLNAV